MRPETLPTLAEILQLPRWARVAFAARCARRVLPQFNANWPDAPPEYAQAVESAVSIAESSARNATVDLVSGPMRAAYAAARDADTYHLARSAAYTAAIAANTAGAAFFGATPADAAEEAAAAAVEAGASASQIRADYNLLRYYSWQHGWTDETPVPPEVFAPIPAANAGTLSPDPVTIEDAEFSLVIQAIVGPEVSAEILSRHLVRLFKALNEYCLEKYGRRLTKDRFYRLVSQPCGVGA